MSRAWQSRSFFSIPKRWHASAIEGREEASLNELYTLASVKNRSVDGTATFVNNMLLITVSSG